MSTGYRRFTKPSQLVRLGSGRFEHGRRSGNPYRRPSKCWPAARIEFLLGAQKPKMGRTIDLICCFMAMLRAIRNSDAPASRLHDGAVLSNWPRSPQLMHPAFELHHHRIIGERRTIPP